MSNREVTSCGESESWELLGAAPQSRGGVWGGQLLLLGPETVLPWEAGYWFLFSLSGRPLCPTAPFSVPSHAPCLPAAPDWDHIPAPSLNFLAYISVSGLCSLVRDRSKLINRGEVAVYA